MPKQYLPLVRSDNISSFEELLETDNSVPVHPRNIQFLLTELNKILNELPLHNGA